jgi:hypothetical protein
MALPGAARAYLTAALWQPESPPQPFEKSHAAAAWLPYRPPLNSDRTALDVFRRCPDRLCRSRPTFHIAEHDMSKGMDSKKTEKKKPAKTMKEKRAAKQEKKKSQ